MVTRKTVKKVKKTLTHSFIAGLTAAMVFAPAANASANDNKQTQIETVYHVYIDEKPIGTISNKDEVEQLLKEKTQKAEEKHPDFEFVPEEEVVFIPEKVFHANTANEKVYNYLKYDLDMEADVAAIQVDEKSVVVVKSEDAAKKVLKKFKLEFISKELLKALNKYKEEQKEQQEDKKSEKASEQKLEQKENEAKKQTTENKKNENNNKEQQDTSNNKSDSEKQSSNQDKKQEPIVEIDGEKILKAEFSKDISIVDTTADASEVLDVKEAVKRLIKGDLEEAKYTVKKGDVLSGIASKFDLSLDELIKLNKKMKGERLLQIGDEITVEKPKPFVKFIVEKKFTEEVELDYETEIRKTDDLYKGEENTVQTGEDGKKRTKYRLVVENGNVIKKKTISEKVLDEPRKEIIEEGTKVVSSRGTGNMTWPASGGITSGFGQRWGEMHAGLDIDGTGSSPIYAADNGVVVSAGWDDGGYGYQVIIDHNNGLKTTYNHLSSIGVSTGEVVRKGERIATMGSTGQSTGTHLHFEVIKNGSKVNPLGYLN